MEDACSTFPANSQPTWPSHCNRWSCPWQRISNESTSAVLGVLHEFDIEGTTRKELPGVFQGPARLASVGVAVNRWIAYHGFTLNVGPYLGLFDLLDEPGIGSNRLRQTSMESRRQRSLPMSKVRESLIRHLEQALELERHHVFTYHPLVRRKVVSHAYAPSPG